MKNKEAKEKLYMEWQKFLEDNIDYAGISEAYKTAFKALEQEPCDNAISRQAAIEAFQMFREYESNRSNKEWVDRIETVLNQLPPVNPTKTEHWIPVSERFPEEDKTVMASTKYGVYPEARYTEENGWEWAYESGADYWKELEDVTAWMPLPKRYKPQESEE